MGTGFDSKWPACVVKLMYCSSAAFWRVGDRMSVPVPDGVRNQGKEF
jgi:hypothetical protein